MSHPLNPWTKHVHAEILRTGRVMSIKEIAATFGKPEGRLLVCERLLQATRRGYFKRHEDKRYEAVPRVEEPPFWNNERLARLREIYPEIGSACHKEFGTTRNAVTKAASENGIAFVPPPRISRKDRVQRQKRDQARRKEKAKEAKAPSWSLPAKPVTSIFNLADQLIEA